MTRLLRLVFAIATLVSALVAQTTTPPNVVIILADDLGFGDVGFNGAKDIQTPNLDRLASTGMRLDRFYACPVCSPTRAGLLTGRWPIRYGLMRAVIPPWSDFGLPNTEAMLPELLADAGYERRGMLGKWHLGHSTKAMLPPQRGFTDYYGHYNGAIDYFTHEREEEIDWHRQSATIKEPGYTTDLLAAEGVRFIEGSPEGKPFLLYAAFNAPHEPLEAKAETLEKYAALSGKRRTYAAMVDSLDQAVGQLLAAVEKRADAENTLVLFMSDNGGLPAFSSNAPWRAGKFSVYEGGIRVCAAIRWPKAGLAGGKKSDALLGYIDVVPTLLKAAGKSVPTGEHAPDGIDMLPVLQKKTTAPDRLWYSYFAQGGRPPGAAVMRGQWKLVHTGGEVLAAKGMEKQELFDLGTDPHEAHDVSADHPDVVSALAVALGQFGGLQKTPGVSEYGEGRTGFKAPKDWLILK